MNSMDLKNTLLAGKRPLLGSFLNVPSPPLAEMLGYAGYDFVVLDAEHGTFGRERMEECVRAAAAVGIPCIVRVADSEAKLILSALDLGADGIQVPQVETADQARAVVRFSHFPPVGERGYGSTTRAAGYGFRPRPEVREMALRRLVVSIQIESRPGVDHLPAILETEGVDVVFIGTSDLSMAYKYDSPNDPAMMPLLEKLISDIRSAGKIPGLHLSDGSKIETLQQLGVRYFTVSALAVMKDAFAGQVKDFLLRVKHNA
jgi:2-keto-3-deoxy-L-rhamnonate aldolase RhmA